MNPNITEEAEAHYDHGLNYRMGTHGYEKDAYKAYCHFKNSALMGHPSAMLHLAHCYRVGVGVKADQANYRKWVIACVETGKCPPPALHSMGAIYAADGDLEAAKRCLYQSFHLGFLPAGLAFAKLKLKEEVMFNDEVHELEIILTECIAKNMEGAEQLKTKLGTVLSKPRPLMH